MSDASSQREWHFYLDDMIVFGGRVMEYTDGLDQTEFVEKANALIRKSFLMALDTVEG